ncbi:MAG: glycoside hydrolase family 95 protein, partial [Woeseiaceae bacterium]
MTSTTINGRRKSGLGRILAALTLLLCVTPVFAAPPTAGQSDNRESPVLRLHFRQPATQWVEALPVGNGRIGAMVFGGINVERLQLNEDTLWAGGPYNPANPAARSALPEIRQKLADGDYAEAQSLVQDAFLSVPLRQMPYQTIGDLLITMPASETAFDYRRELDLDTGIARVSFRIGGVEYEREVFASPVNDVIVMRLAARDVERPDRNGRLKFSLAFQSPLPALSRGVGSNELLLDGSNGSANGVDGALRFEARVRVLLEKGIGTVANSGQQLHVSGADGVVIIVAAATSYRRFDDVSGDPTATNAATIEAAAQLDFDSLRDAHVAEHQRLFRRVTLDLGETPAAELPT